MSKIQLSVIGSQPFIHPKDWSAAHEAYVTSAKSSRSAAAAAAAADDDDENWPPARVRYASTEPTDMTSV